MSTPIKPPGGPKANGPNGEDAAPQGRVEGRSGELRSMVEDAERSVEGPTVGQAAEPNALSSIERDMTAGRIDVEQAIDRLVARALERAAELPASQRAELEVNLRNALAEDPTLLALRKDLERGSS